MSAAVVVTWVLPGWRAIRAPIGTPVKVSGWGAAPDPFLGLFSLLWPLIPGEHPPHLCVTQFYCTLWPKRDFSGIQGWFNIKSLILTELGGWIHDHSRRRKHLTKPNIFLKKYKNTPQTKNKGEFLQLEKGHLCETANIILNGKKLDTFPLR